MKKNLNGSNAICGIAILLFAFMLSSSVSLAQDARPKAKSLFDGKTLTGWKTITPAEQALWKAADGMIVGGNGKDKVKFNSYICTEKEFEDFALFF